MDSIIFDLDGTLWDSREAVADSWNQVFKKVGFEVTKADLTATMGLQIHEISEKFFPDMTVEQRKEIMDECCEVENEHMTKVGGLLYPQLEEVLEKLAAKYELFIVSNCQEGYIESFYAYHGLEKYFKDFENPGRTGLSKGENIKLIIERNQLKDPVYVGDTAGDQKAAKHAGVPFVYASYGFGEVEDADYTIRNFGELLELF